MRAMAYVIAALAAVGIMIGIATVPDPPDPQAPDPQVKEPQGDATVASVASDHRVMDEPGTLVLGVPSMSCEFACYPSVKKILESNEAVQSVELAEQKEEGTIDNRAVIVSYDAGFNLDAAIAQLGREGFAESDVVQ